MSRTGSVTPTYSEREEEQIWKNQETQLRQKGVIQGQG
jgi:hypothetical protein